MTPILISEHPTVAHRPALAPHQQYVQWTEHHQHQAQGLPPCAIHLWQYLLYKYPGGVPQEIEQEEVRFEIFQRRSKIYCVQSLKNALWQCLVPRGLVEVVKQFTKRVMRVVANHAGPIKEIEKKFEPPKVNLYSTKLLYKSEAVTIESAFSIQRSSKSTQSPTDATEKAGVEQGDCAQQELEESRAAITNAPFMQYSEQPQSSSTAEPPVKDKFAVAVARTILERLRSLGISQITEVRKLIAQTEAAQLERNVSALEEETTIKGLNSPIAAFKYFVSNNCQPRLWDRQSWWNRAAAALGKQQRDRLMQSVTEYAGDVVVIFTSGKRISLQEAQGMSL